MASASYPTATDIPIANTDVYKEYGTYMYTVLTLIKLSFLAKAVASR
jgi:hypothetical protein